MKSKFYEVMAWIIGIVGIIGSIVAGFQFPTSTYNSVTEEFTTGFNMGMTVICLISVAVLCMILLVFPVFSKSLNFFAVNRKQRKAMKTIAEVPIRPINGNAQTAIV